MLAVEGSRPGVRRPIGAGRAKRGLPPGPQLTAAILVLEAARKIEADAANPVTFVLINSVSSTPPLPPYSARNASAAGMRMARRTGT